MKARRIFSLVLALTMTMGILPTMAQRGDVAYARTQTILLDGEPVELQAYALKDAQGYETNYVKLRDVALLLDGTPAQFEVDWDGVVSAYTGQSYTPNGTEMTTPFEGDRPYTSPASPTRIDGVETALEAIMLTDDAGGGYTYYKLRDLGDALGFTVDWSAETGVTLDTGTQYAVDRDTVTLTDGEYDWETFEQVYFAPAKRLSEFDPFTGEVTEGTLSKGVTSTWEEYEKAGELDLENVTLRALMVDGVPVYEAWRDDGTEKPVVFLLHGGGSDKDANNGHLPLLASMGLYVVALDSAGSGESDRGPLMAPQAFAETVFSIDTLLEYYNTVDQADASNAAIVGGSMGGNIGYCYVAHGKYQLRLLVASLGTPDLTLLGDMPLFDCFDRGENYVTACWTEEQTRAFAAAYSPAQYPERFLDTYIFAGNGALDVNASPEGPQALEAALTALGGENFLFYVDPDRGHERLPEFYDALFTVLEQVMLEGTIPQASELGLD